MIRKASDSQRSFTNVKQDNINKASELIVYEKGPDRKACAVVVVSWWRSSNRPEMPEVAQARKALYSVRARDAHLFTK